MAKLPSLFTAIAISSLALQGIKAKIVSSVSELRQSYDFVVVGGGTAGNVVANRLTEDPGATVLVIEAGISNDGQEDIIVPFFAVQASPDTIWTWNYTTTPQAALNNRIVNYPRGRVLGGSSSINFMVYTRGPIDDFDRYAAFTGDEGWSWNSLQEFILKVEKLVPPADGHNTTGMIDPSIHGTNGNVDISIRGAEMSIDDMVVETTQQLAGEFPFNLDMNNGKPLGVGWVQSSIGDGERSSSATGYLASQFLSRQNLDVIVETQVTKVFKTGTANGLPVIGGVEFAQSRSGPRYNVTARKEVILSAGAVNTPQILLLSGIGDNAALEKLGIETLVDSPDVGQKFIDHPLLSSQFNVTGTNTSDTVRQNATLFMELFEQYNTTGQGLFVDSPIDHIGWFRIPDNSTIFDNTTDPSAGPTAPHHELLFSNGFASFVGETPSEGHYLSISSSVVSPASRGSLTLNSTDPFDFPIIDPGFFSSPVDLAIMVESIKAARRFLTAPTWKDYIITPFGSGANLTTDADFEAFARANTGTIFHPAGTAAMAPKDAAPGVGVVNSDLTVRGVSGLRVVDASVFPFIPAAHPQSAVYVFGERASSLIKEKWGLSSK